jgi:hypothetical protein
LFKFAEKIIMKKIRIAVFCWIGLLWGCEQSQKHPELLTSILISLESLHYQELKQAYEHSKELIYRVQAKGYPLEDIANFERNVTDLLARTIVQLRIIDDLKKKVKALKSTDKRNIRDFFLTQKNGDSLKNNIESHGKWIIHTFQRMNLPIRNPLVLAHFFYHPFNEIVSNVPIEGKSVLEFYFGNATYTDALIGLTQIQLGLLSYQRALINKLVGERDIYPSLKLDKPIPAAVAQSYVVQLGDEYEADMFYTSTFNFPADLSIVATNDGRFIQKSLDNTYKIRKSAYIVGEYSWRSTIGIPYTENSKVFKFKREYQVLPRAKFKKEFLDFLKEN